jgi:hypothetical protein
MFAPKKGRSGSRAEIPCLQYLAARVRPGERVAADCRLQGIEGLVGGAACGIAATDRDEGPELSLGMETGLYFCEASMVVPGYPHNEGRG